MEKYFCKKFIIKNLVISFLFILMILDFSLYAQSKKNNEQIITSEWQEKIRFRVEDDIKYLKNIVLEGEKNIEIQNEFFNKFTELKGWFFDKIENSRAFFDQDYVELITKKDELETLISYQKKADILLANALKKEQINESLYNNLRVLVLYDINSLIHDKALKVSDAQIEKIVKKYLSEAIESKKTETKSFDGTVSAKEESNSADLDRLKKELQNLKGSFEKFKKQKTLLNQNVSKEIENKNKKNLDLEIKLEQAKSDMEEKNKAKLSSDLMLEVAKRNVEKLKLEEKKCDNKELQIKLEKFQKDIDALKAELNKSKERENQKRLEAEQANKVAQSATKNAVEVITDYKEVMTEKEKKHEEKETELNDKERHLEIYEKKLEEEKLQIIDQEEELLKLKKELEQEALQLEKINK